MTTARWARAGCRTVHSLRVTGSCAAQVVDTSIKFVAPIKPRIHPMRLFVVSDAYVGSDELVQFKLNVVPAASLPELELHAEDRMLDEELEREVEDAGNASDSAADSDSDNDSESEADEDGAERISKRRARNSGVAASSSTPKAPAKLEDTLTEVCVRRQCACCCGAHLTRAGRAAAAQQAPCSPAEKAAGR